MTYDGKYLLENTKYASSSNPIQYWWLESPYASTLTNVVALDSSSKSFTNISVATENVGVRPVIEVLIDKILY